MYSGLHDFYRSSEWEAFRARFLAERMLRDGELRCEACGKPILRPYEGILHHKDELDELKVMDPGKALDDSNIMLVCHFCHDAIHERWGHQRSRHVYLVWGCPCSGKRAYVDSSRGRHDIVVDIDAIYNSLGGERGSVKAEALAMYQAAVDRIRTRGGRWRNAWIIRTLPRSADRERLQRDLGGAESIHIERSPEECRREAVKRGGSWPEWVEAYLRDFCRRRGNQGSAVGYLSAQGVLRGGIPNEQQDDSNPDIDPRRGAGRRGAGLLLAGR